MSLPSSASLRAGEGDSALARARVSAIRLPSPRRIALTLALLTLCGLHIWAVRYRLDVLDEGYFMYSSSRVAAGDLPYRDFSTPYTPGFFYLNALLFRIFGTDLMTLRLSLLLARFGLFALLYLLGRRIMPPAFAFVPVMIILLSDQAPGVWESHPAWWGTLAFVAAVWGACRYADRGAVRWLFGAGMAAGAAFAFKQNLGIFALVAVAAFILTEERSLPGLGSPEWLVRPFGIVPRAAGRWLLWAAGPVSLIALSALIAWGMRQLLEPLLFFSFALPLAALALVDRRREVAPAPPVGPAACRVPQRMAATFVRLAVVAAGFTIVTVPWLLLLVSALGVSETPMAAFLGAVGTEGYFLPFEQLRPNYPWVVLLALLAPITMWLLLQRIPWWLKIATLLGSISLGAALGLEVLRPAVAVDARPVRAAVLITVQATTGLLLHLPSVAFWSALALLISRQVPQSHRFRLRWYLLAGSLLILNQYPRIDETHLLFSGPLLWVVGSYVLWRLFASATRAIGHRPLDRVARFAMYLSFLAVPMVVLFPVIEPRRQELAVRGQGELLPLNPPRYVWLDLPGARVFELESSAWKYVQIAAYFREQTQPGERIFVYPAAPLLYYLVDRPNATRFNHVFPGLLTDEDEIETIERLRSVPATHVIWDTFGADFWGKPGTYQRLIDYVWDNYQVVASVGGYEIMQRNTR